MCLLLISSVWKKKLICILAKSSGRYRQESSKEVMKNLEIRQREPGLGWWQEKWKSWARSKDWVFERSLPQSSSHRRVFFHCLEKNQSVFHPWVSVESLSPPPTLFTPFPTLWSLSFFLPLPNPSGPSSIPTSSWILPHGFILLLLPPL